MRIVLQRVSEARVEVDGVITGQIGEGALLLLGIARQDDRAAAGYLVQKTLDLRIFPDAKGRMNRSIAETGGALLVVSQFTLMGSCAKGRRPSFDRAAPPQQALALYDYFVSALREKHPFVQTGIFQARMRVHLVNDGPITLLYDSERML